jgi:hypothetical protein
LVRRNGGGELDIARLTDGGPVMGLLPDAEYRQGQAAPPPSSSTRTACSPPSGSTRTARQPRCGMKSFDEFTPSLGKALPQDDLTLLVARIRG